MNEKYGSKVEITPEFVKKWEEKTDLNDPAIRIGIFIGQMIVRSLAHAFSFRPEP
jgi:hypothetical protein